VGRPRFVLRRLLLDSALVVAALPVGPVLSGQLQRTLARDIADDGDGRVFGAIKAAIELKAVIVLVGHVLNVAEIAHRRMRVGVLFEGRLAQDFMDLEERVGAVLVVFAEHGERLCLVLLGRVLETLKAVGLGAHDRFEVFLREGGVIDGPVVRGVSVGFRSGALENLLALFGREILAAAEHHVLEEVCEAALARLNLVARAGRDDDVERDEIRVIGRDGDEPEPVRQVVNRIVVRENFALALLLCEAEDGQREQQRRE
jgi:hypothetical protein